MKAAGIIRRVDDLGRVVIPKEVRRNLGIKAGDPLEIYTEGKAVCFVKYSVLDDMASKVAPIVDALNKTGILCALYDNCNCRVCGDRNAPVELEYDAFHPNYFAIAEYGEHIGFLAVATETPENTDVIKFAISSIAEMLREDEE